MHLLRKALPTFNGNPDGGVFLMSSSVAGVGFTGSTMAYSVSKAAGKAHGFSPTRRVADIALKVCI